MAYKLDSNLSENQIESDVASFLGYVTPFWSSRFRLISVNEQSFGADKLFNKFIPIYLQFKVSDGLKAVTRSELPKFNFPLQRIRRYRFDNNLNGDPILYFKLRDKAKNAEDFQHNVLYSFHKPPHQFALYVSPLTIDIDEYSDLLKMPFFERLIIVDPFRFHPSEIYRGAVKESFGLIPFLRAHVSIPPVETVTSSNHYYSFSKNGADVVWHRGGVKQMDDFRLSTQISRIYNLAYNNEQLAVSKQEYHSRIPKLYTDLAIGQNNEEDAELSILKFASDLYEHFRIRLFFLGVNEQNSR